MVILEYIDTIKAILENIDKAILKNIDIVIDKDNLENIDIDKDILKILISIQTFLKY